ncbi:hypothetical protein FPRO04_04855 [Fusarium proliferatum]|nr:hypothetical protein FPRO04_04855 [Fusarium proliferatum]
MNLQKSQVMGPRPSIHEEQWLQYKEIIRYQFLVRNMSLKELVRFLSCMGFTVTSFQLQFKLKAWGILKKMDKPTWQYIDRKINKRKAQGKDTDVILSGRRLKRSATSKAITDHGAKDIFTQMAQGLGILDLQIDVKVFSDVHVTMGALLETLFECAIEWAPDPKHDPNQSFDLLRWLLKSGQDPNKKMRRKELEISTGRERRVRPIEFAILMGQAPLLELLLDFGADINYRGFFGKSALELALESARPHDIKIDIVHLLIRYDVSLRWEEVLYAAISLRDLDLINSLLTTGVDLTKAMEADHNRGSLHEQTVLSAAIAAGNDVTEAILNQMAFMDPSRLNAPLITADTFIAAAAKGADSIINRLHEIDPTIGNTRNPRGITPVQVAVSVGHLSTCRLLLRLYGGYSPALLFLAAYLEHGDILQFLLNEGADVNEAIPPADLPECVRVCHDLMDRFKRKSSPSVFETLLHTCAWCPLWATSEQPQFYYLRTLIENGARLTGSETYYLAKSAPADTILAALTHGSSANVQNKRGQSALQIVIDSVTEFYNSTRSFQVKRRLQAVQILLSHGAKRYAGEIVSVIRSQDRDLLSLVLRYHPGWEDTDKRGVSSLEAAIACLGCGVSLLGTTAYKSYYDPGSLCAAAQTKDMSLIELILTNRHTHSEYHVFEGTAVGLVAMSGRLDCLQHLIQYFPEAKEAHSALLPVHSEFKKTITGVVFWYDKPLFWRYPGHSCECVYGSPLALASLGSNISCFEELLRQGYKADPLTWITIADSQSRPHLELLARYQQRLDNFLPTTSWSSTALCTAVERGNKEIVQCLLNAGADINEYGLNEYGQSRSPLQLSVEAGNLELVNCLLHDGANVNAPPADNSGATALQLAAIEGHLGIARELLNHGALVNARGARSHGRTSLEGAAEYGRVNMLELLIYHGALITGPGRDQFVRAVRLATKGSFYVAADLLKRSGGWTKEDGRHLSKRHRSADLDGHCCAVIHDSDTQCIHETIKTERETYRFKIMPHPSGHNRRFSLPNASDLESEEEDSEEEHENVEAVSGAI